MNTPARRLRGLAFWDEPPPAAPLALTEGNIVNVWVTDNLRQRCRNRVSNPRTRPGATSATALG